MSDFLVGFIIGVCGITIINKIYEGYKKVREEDKKGQKEDQERQMVQVIGEALLRGNPKIKIDCYPALKSIDIFSDISSDILAIRSEYSQLVLRYNEQVAIHTALMEELGYNIVKSRDKVILIKKKRKE